MSMGTASRIYIGDEPQALVDAALSDAAGLMCARGGDKPCGVCIACKKVLSRRHVDVRVLDNGPEGTVKVDEIRDLRRDLFVRPFDGERKINIIAFADTMNAGAQNALLTVLEEPPPYAFFFLLTGRPHALLPTVRSRCAQVRLPPAPEPQPAPEDTARAGAYLSAAQSGDMWETAVAALSLEKLTRDELSRVLSAGVLLLEKMLRAQPSPWAVAMCEKFLGLISELDGNASVGTVCGVLMIEN